MVGAYLNVCTYKGCMCDLLQVRDQLPRGRNTEAPKSFES